MKPSQVYYSLKIIEKNQYKNGDGDCTVKVRRRYGDGDDDGVGTVTVRRRHCDGDGDNDG